MTNSNNKGQTKTSAANAKPRKSAMVITQNQNA